MFRQTSLVATTLLLAIGVAGAAEKSLLSPPGWVFEDYAYAATPSTAAAVAYKYKDDPHHKYDKSLVIQSQADGQLYSTELAGKVFYLEYSRSGEYLLAGQVGHSDSGAIRTSLLNNHGQVLWSKEGVRKLLSFSTNGSAIVAWERGQFGGSGTFEVFDISGQLKHRLAFGEHLQGVIAVGGGSDVILFSEKSIMRYAVDGKVMRSIWRNDLAESSASIDSASVLDRDKIAVELRNGTKLIVTTEGQIAFTYVVPPPSGSAQLQPSGTGEQVVEATDETVSVLNTATATVTEYDVQPSPLIPSEEAVQAPAGFTLLSRPSGGRIFYFSPQEIQVK